MVYGVIYILYMDLTWDYLNNINTESCIESLYDASIFIDTRIMGATYLGACQDLDLSVDTHLVYFHQFHIHGQFHYQL